MHQWPLPKTQIEYNLSRFVTLYQRINSINMTVILVLVIFSMVVAGGFLGAFLWAVRSGQYDDTYSPSVRILFEDKTREQQANHGNGKF